MSRAGEGVPFRKPWETNLEVADKEGQMKGKRRIIQRKVKRTKRTGRRQKQRKL